MFWVPGGTATIYAVKNAGLAIGIGVGSSFIVLVSFTWGIFVFGYVQYITVHYIRTYIRDSVQLYCIWLRVSWMFVGPRLD